MEEGSNPFINIINRLFAIPPLTVSAWLVWKGLSDPSDQLCEVENGYAYLSPFIPQWTEYRGYLYIFGVVLLIVAGSLIMLYQRRKEESPDAYDQGEDRPLSGIISTTSNLLPNIILYLILSTFSYSIAGLVIDVYKLISCNF